MTSIRRLQPADWRSYRDLRLRALREAPDAFGSTHDAEAARPDALWAARLAEAAASAHECPLWAWHGPQPCGLVWARLPADEPRIAQLFQMWVDPQSRGLGVGRALLDAAVAWTRRAGARWVCLDVSTSQTAALSLYRACGFKEEGALHPLREGSAVMVQPMRLDLAPAAPLAPVRGRD